MEQWRAQWERISEELASAERSIHVEDTRLEQLAAQGQRLEKEQQKHIEERQALSFAEIESSGSRAWSATRNGSSRLARTRRALSRRCGRRFSSCASRRRRCRTHLDQLREGLQNDRGRLTSLEALQEAALGKSTEQVNRWLQAQTLDERRRLAQELVVEAGWERAVETVLGPYLQAVSVESIDAIAGSLAGAHRGRPDASIETDRRRGASDARRAAGTHARRPPPSRRCSSACAWRSPRRRRSRAAHELADGESFVTRDGVWIGRHWVRMNRSDDPQVGVIARGDEIKRLREKHARRLRAAPTRSPRR